MLSASADALYYGQQEAKFFDKHHASEAFPTDMFSFPLDFDMPYHDRKPMKWGLFDFNTNKLNITPFLDENWKPVKENDNKQLSVVDLGLYSLFKTYFSPNALMHEFALGLEGVRAVGSFLSCGLCKSTVDPLRDFLSLKIVHEIVDVIVIQACPPIVATMGFKKEVCPGIIHQQVDDMIYPIIVDHLLDEFTACSLITEMCPQTKYKKIDVKEWYFYLLNSKPEQIRNNDFVNKLYEKESKNFRTPGREPIKIAVISDLHIDFDYTPGMSNRCGKPLCCRSDSGLPTSEFETAGKWGDFECDPPAKTIINAL